MQLAEGRAEPDSAIPFDRARRLGSPHGNKELRSGILRRKVASFLSTFLKMPVSPRELLDMISERTHEAESERPASECSEFNTVL